MFFGNTNVRVMTGKAATKTSRIWNGKLSAVDRHGARIAS